MKRTKAFSNKYSKTSSIEIFSVSSAKYTMRPLSGYKKKIMSFGNEQESYTYRTKWLFLSMKEVD